MRHDKLLKEWASAGWTTAVWKRLVGVEVRVKCCASCARCACGSESECLLVTSPCNGDMTVFPWSSCRYWKPAKGVGHD